MFLANPSEKVSHDIAKCRAISQNIEIAKIQKMGFQKRYFAIAIFCDIQYKFQCKITFVASLYF